MTRARNNVIYGVVMVIMALGVGVGLAAQHPQQLLPPDSLIYGLVESVLLESGKLPNSLARPWSVVQVRQHLAMVDPAVLSEAGRAAYDAVLKRLEPRSIFEDDGFSFDIGAAAGFGAYGRSDQANPWPDAVYGKRMPLLTVPLNLGLGPAFLEGEVELREEYFAIPKDSFNIPGDVGWFDLQFPFLAYGAIGDEHLSLGLGRTKLSMGPGSFSQILISDQPDYLDWLSFKGAWDPFVYSAWAVSLDPSLLPGQSDGPEAVRNFFLHRFEASLFDNRVYASVTEGIMTGGVQPELKYFIPLAIFHNFMDWTHASSLLSVELAANLWQYLRVYGQFAFNRVPVDYEQRVYGEDENPFGRAYLAGAEFKMPVGPGYLGVVAEFYYTDPFMYVRESPFVSYAWHRRVLSNVLGSGATAVVSKPLGYAFGSDSWNVYGQLGYSVADWLAVDLSGVFAVIGENDIDSEFHRGNAAVQMSTPSGTPEFLLRLGLAARWRVFDWLEVSGSLACARVENAGHRLGTVVVDWQPSIEARVGIGKVPSGWR